MIRQSSAIAAAALLVSLFLHLLGLSFSSPSQRQSGTTALPENTLEIGTRFEDLVEVQPDPVEPEPAPAPEPQPAEAPTSDARVASENPQQTSRPDTGVSNPGPSQATGPVTPELGSVPDPETADSSQGDASDRVAFPAPTSAVSPQPTEIEAVPVDAAAAPPTETSPVEPGSVPPTESLQTEQLAALPPQDPVAPPGAVAEQPVPDQTLAPLPEATPQEPESVQVPPPPAPDAEQAEGESSLAVARSLRPKAPAARPPASLPAENTRLSRAGLPERLATRTIESPLTAYKRDGTDIFAGRSGGTRSGGLGFQNSGGPGNASETNYAGQVLVHLNRVPPVPVSGRGWARVIFEISADGGLAWVDVIDGSGSSSIERAAKEQVRIAAPFPKPPGGKSRKLNFVYQIQ